MWHVRTLPMFRVMVMPPSSSFPAYTHRFYRKLKQQFAPTSVNFHQNARCYIVGDKIPHSRHHYFSQPHTHPPLLSTFRILSHLRPGVLCSVLSHMFPNQSPSRALLKYAAVQHPRSHHSFNNYGIQDVPTPLLCNIFVRPDMERIHLEYKKKSI